MFIHGARKVLPLFNANDEKIGTINGRIFSCCNEYKNEFVASFEFEPHNDKSYFHFTEKVHNDKLLYVVFKNRKYWLSKLQKDFDIEYNNSGKPFYYYYSKIIDVINGKNIFIFQNDELISKLVMIEKTKAAKQC